VSPALSSQSQIIICYHIPIGNFVKGLEHYGLSLHFPLIQGFSNEFSYIEIQPKLGNNSS